MSEDLGLGDLDSADPALEAQLRAAFAAHAPSRAFTQSLRSRLEPRTPWWERALGGGAMRALAPALAVLVVVAAVGAVLSRSLPRAGGASLSTSAPFATSAGDFGALPPLRQGQGAAAIAGASAPARVPAPADAAASQATTTFPARVAVYRQQPQSPEARSAGIAALAARSGLPLVLDSPYGQPYYRSVVSEPVSAPDPGQAATAFLAGHGLTPQFKYRMTVTGDGVLFSEVFERGDGIAAPAVVGPGTPLGTRVTIAGGRVTSVSGPLDQPFERALYPLLPVASVRAQLPGELESAAATLVYVPVVEPSPGGAAIVYWEPAYQFSGPAGGALLAAVPTR